MKSEDHHTVRVAPGKLNELDAIYELECRVFPGDRLSRRSLRSFLVRPGKPLRVARIGDEFAGYALVVARRGGRSARLYSIAVAPEASGRGVARALMAAAERYALRSGGEALRLEVREDNHAAIRLYEKLGYRSFARHEDYYDDGAAALRYEKPLA